MAQIKLKIKKINNGRLITCVAVVIWPASA